MAIQVLETLVKYEDNIKETDIEREFKKFGDDYLWIMEKWFSHPNFESHLELFNIRKKYIKAMTLDKFIKEHYPQAHSKFYNTLLKKKRVKVCEIIELLHPGIDVSELLNLGTNDDHIGPFTRAFTEILRKLGYPIHFL